MNNNNYRLFKETLLRMAGEVGLPKNAVANDLGLLKENKEMDNKKLGQLNNLQNASPTGGSLGNLSNFEMLLLNRMRQLSPTGGLLDGPNKLMTQMQSCSPTGGALCNVSNQEVGALGNVSNKELDMLIQMLFK